ncbi:hypothetical protein SAMN02745866_03929 [Alteromonadaceae bacterium Bs31]|nr:hypothetical protein SAMN02745866_03929 [Alteromonadaceae bacterium Bs31]
MHKIFDTINQVNTRIEKAARAAGRNPKEITLLAVSKRQTEDAIKQAYQAGLRDFGENYVQEALAKIERLPLEGICWHFIGPIQSNKTKSIAEHFAWVHSVDRLKIAQRLNNQRHDKLPPLNICLQVNIDDEASKSGFAADEVSEIAQQVVQLPRLRLRGLMAIPQRALNAQQSTDAFKRMHGLLHSLKKQPALTTLDTLSMGMSGDMESAIAEGANIVRVGTALFGARSDTTASNNN